VEPTFVTGVMVDAKTVVLVVFVTFVVVAIDDLVLLYRLPRFVVSKLLFLQKNEITCLKHVYVIMVNGSIKAVDFVDIGFVRTLAGRNKNQLAIVMKT